MTANVLAVVLSVAVSLLVYFTLLVGFKVFGEKELEGIPFYKLLSGRTKKKQIND